jgi:adenine-specific DNA-methyltransferase
MLVRQLTDDDTLLVCGTSVADDADARLRELRPGSRARKVPASILADYQRAYRWRPKSVSAQTADPRVGAIPARYQKAMLELPETIGRLLFPSGDTPEDTDQ